MSSFLSSAPLVWTEYSLGFLAYNTNFTQAHGKTSLNQIKAFEVWLECNTADNGYAIGDIVKLQSLGSSQGAVVWYNATLLGFTLDSNPIAIPPKGGGAWANLTAGRWRIYFRVLS